MVVVIMTDNDEIDRAAAPPRAMPGRRTRAGPMRPNGPACDVNTGSVMMTVEAVRIRNVEWPMNVTATSPAATRAGGSACRVSGTCVGHAVRCRVRIHLMTSLSGRADRCGLKKRLPSQ